MCFPLIAEAAAALRVNSFLIDGEAVCCDGNGVPVFDRLRYRRDDRHVFLYAFDLLQVDSRDLRREPIEDRKAELAKLLRRAKPGLQLNEQISEPGDIVFRTHLQARPGRHRIEAEGLDLSLRPLAGLAQDEKPGVRGGAAGGGRGLGSVEAARGALRIFTGASS